MPEPSDNLHGNAPDSHPLALLLVDVINPLDFPEADQLLRYAMPAAQRLANLKARARARASRSFMPMTTSAAGDRTSRP